MNFPVERDRWERKLSQRGGQVQRRSGKFTKPGPRPRAACLKALRMIEEEEPIEIGYDTKRFIPRAQSPTFEAETIDGTTLKIIGNPYLRENEWYIVSQGTSANVTSGSSVDCGIIYTPNTSISYGNNWTDQTVYPGPWQQNDPVSIASPFMFTPVPLDPKEARKQDLQNKLRAQIIEQDPRNHHGALARANHRSANFTSVSPAEIKALEMLKSMLDEISWRKYLKYGFITVQGQSGLLYQIVRDQQHIRVYRRGNKVTELCIYVHGVPPTDEVIAKKIMLECSEMKVWHDASIKSLDQKKNWLDIRKPTEQELIQLAA